MVGIFDAFRRIWETCQREWRQETSTKGFVQEMVDSISLNWGDFAYFLLIGILVTLFRQELNRRLLQPLSNKFNFQAKDAANFPECTFKFFVYLALYGAECYVLLSSYREFLINPQAPWTDWHMGMKVPPSIYWIYVCEAGFYIHGIYGTMFMDIWRDDSVMLIIHHILTISLVVFSLGLRYHNIGLVVLFLHDIADVFLEFTKIVKCFQNRNKSQKSIYSVITSLGFILFASSWIGCRIVLYPTVVLYSTGYEARQVLPDAPFYFFFNFLLWILFIMNVWWSYFIVLLIFRIISGKSKSIEDTRELSVPHNQIKETEGQHMNGNLMKTGIKCNGISYMHKGTGKYKNSKENMKESKFDNVGSMEYEEVQYEASDIRKRF